MSTPQRVQRKRTKGWKMPAGTIYVGRGSKWGNPFRSGEFYKDRTGFHDCPYPVLKPFFMRETHTITGKLITIHCNPISGATQAVELYRRFVAYNDDIFTPEAIAALTGKNLACWCPLTDAQGNHVPCHADVLLEIANQDQEEEK